MTEANTKSGVEAAYVPIKVTINIREYLTWNAAHSQNHINY